MIRPAAATRETKLAIAQLSPRLQRTRPHPDNATPTRIGDQKKDATATTDNTEKSRSLPEGPERDFLVLRLLHTTKITLCPLHYTLSYLRPTWSYCRTKVPIHCAFTSGTARMASAAAFTMQSVTEMPWGVIMC